jgi:hypothetical protein
MARNPGNNLNRAPRQPTPEEEAVRLKNWYKQQRLEVDTRVAELRSGLPDWLPVTKLDDVFGAAYENAKLELNLVLQQILDVETDSSLGVRDEVQKLQDLSDEYRAKKNALLQSIDNLLISKKAFTEGPYLNFETKKFELDGILKHLEGFTEDLIGKGLSAPADIQDILNRVQAAKTLLQQAETAASQPGYVPEVVAMSVENVDGLIAEIKDRFTALQREVVAVVRQEAGALTESAPKVEGAPEWIESEATELTKVKSSVAALEKKYPRWPEVAKDEMRVVVELIADSERALANIPPQHKTYEVALGKYKARLEQNREKLAQALLALQERFDTTIVTPAASPFPAPEQAFRESVKGLGDEARRTLDGYIQHGEGLKDDAAKRGIDIAVDLRLVFGKVEALANLLSSLQSLMSRPAVVAKAVEETKRSIQALTAEIDQAFVDLQRKLNDAVVAKSAETAAPAPAAAAPEAKSFALKTGEAAPLLGEARRILNELAGKTPANLDEARVMRGQAKEAWRNAKPIFDQAEAEYQRIFAARESVRAAKTFGKDSVDDGPLRAAEVKRDEARVIYQRALAASYKYREAEVEFRKRDLPAQLTSAEISEQASLAAATSRIRIEQPGLTGEAFNRAVASDVAYAMTRERAAALRAAQGEIARRDRIRAGREEVVLRARAEKPDGTLEGKKKSESVKFVPLEERMQVAVRRGLIDNSLAAEQKATVDAIKNNPGYWSRAKAAMIEKVTTKLKNPDGTWNKKSVSLVGAIAVGGLSGVLITSPALLAAMPVGFAARYFAKKGASSLGRKLFVSGTEKQLGKEKEQATRDIFAGDVSSMAKSQRSLQSSIDTRTKWVNRTSEVAAAVAGVAAGGATKIGLEYGFPETFAGRAAQAATQPGARLPTSVGADARIVLPEGEAPAATAPQPPGAPPPPAAPPPPTEPPTLAVSRGGIGSDAVAAREAASSPAVTSEVAPRTTTTAPTRPGGIGSDAVAAREAAAPPSAPEVAPRLEVRRGNVLSRLLHDQMIEAQGGQSVPPAERQRLARLMYERFPEMRAADGIRATTPVERWALTPDQWREVGVRSGNPNLIQPGEQINMRRLLEMASGRPAPEPPLPVPPIPPQMDAVDLGEYNAMPRPIAPMDAVDLGQFNAPEAPPTTTVPTRPGGIGSDAVVAREAVSAPPAPESFIDRVAPPAIAAEPGSEAVPERNMIDNVATGAGLGGSEAPGGEPPTPAEPTTRGLGRGGNLLEQMAPPPAAEPSADPAPVYRESPLPAIDGRIDLRTIDQGDATPVTINTRAVAERVAEQGRVLVVERASLDDPDFMQFVNQEFGSAEKFMQRRDALLSEINPKRGFLENLFSVAVNDNLPVNEALPDVTLEDFMAANQSPAQIAEALREGDDSISVNPDSITRWRRAIPELVARLQDKGLEIDPEETTISELTNAAAANDISLRTARRVA